MNVGSEVFVTRLIPEAGLARLRQACRLEVWEHHGPPPRSWLLERVRDLEGLLTLSTEQVDEELMDAAPRLRVISNYGVGLDNIDIPAATSRGIAVGHTPDVLTDATADFAFGLMLAVARWMGPARDYARNADWATWGPLLFLGQDVHHATLGLVGLGRIGTAMAERARGFRMRVLYYDVVRSRDKETELGLAFRDLPQLLAESDFVSLHTPLAPETHHLIDAAAIALMKPTAVLVNASRGAVIDGEALYEALSSHKIQAAGLDVTDPEPLPCGHNLLSLENCFVTPHIASASVGAREAMAVLAAENLLAGLQGRPLRASPNPEVRRRV